MEDDPIITIDDVRAVGYCVRGMRHWAQLHKLDFEDFMLNGISASKILATGDHLGANIVSKAKERLHGHGRG